MRVDTKSRSNPLRRRLRRIGRWERREEARAFIELHGRESGTGDAAVRARVKAALSDLARHGWYEHTPEELAFGARVAWRNHARCIGRQLWKSLDVVDCRAAMDPDDIAQRVFEQVRQAGSSRSMRPTISVFAPVRGDRLPAYVESRQVGQYACHVLPSGGMLGDPLNAEATRVSISLGWRPPSERTRFDLLPLLVRDEADRRRLYRVPDGAIREVDLRHPHDARFDRLGLRWYAVPCISGMILTIGGIDYPCAPFNGFYMGTEIASRNLADERRYDLLPEVAAALGIPRSDPLWKDRALLELNAAVLDSFRTAGVAMVDHHEASAQYMDFIQREASEGREPSGDWPWIVPPQAAPACPVFHLAMRDRRMVPNYYWSRASDGGDLAPRYEDLAEFGKWSGRWERIRRRYLRWRSRKD